MIRRPGGGAIAKKEDAATLADYKSALNKETQYIPVLGKV